MRLDKKVEILYSDSSDSAAQQPTSGESSLINFKLIRNPIFGLFTIAFALADLGFYVPYIYIVDLAVNKVYSIDI